MSSPADRIIAFDYYGTGKMDHLVLYRPGAGLIAVVEHGGGNTFYLMGVWGNGLGGWDLSSPADKVIAFDYYGTGKMDHLVMYRPGTGLIAVVEHGSSNTFYLMGVWSNGLGGWDLSSPADRVIAFDYYGTGRMDHLVMYRPGTGLIAVVEHGSSNTFYLMGVWGNGLAGYDLSSSADQIIAFDYDGTGVLDHLVMYRPGTGLLWIVEHGSSNTFYPMAIFGSGIAGYDLMSSSDQALPFDFASSSKQNYLLLYRPGAEVIAILQNYGANNFQQVFTSGSSGSAAIVGGPGVPFQGSSHYQLSFSGSSQVLVTLVQHGSGLAVFDDGSTAKTLNGSTTLTVLGRSPSETQNDIELRVTSPTGLFYANLYFSVVSVSISVNISGSYDSDDTAVPDFTGGTSGLDTPGSTIFRIAGNPRGFCGEAVEYVGTVTPSNYSSPVVLSRYILGEGDYAGSSPVTLTPPFSKNDTAPPGFQVRIPHNGKIFDLDDPGVSSAGYYPDGSFAPPERIRLNFIEYALLDAPPPNDNFPDSFPNIVSSFFYAGAPASCVGDLYRRA